MTKKPLSKDEKRQERMRKKLHKVNILKVRERKM